MPGGVLGPLAHHGSRMAGETLPAVLLLACPLLVWGRDDDIAPTPPMGYNTWNDLFRHLNETNVRLIAARLKDLGFLALGYRYVVLDDLWMDGDRDADGRLQPDKFRFKSGIGVLADYVHSLGLKLGIYTSRGLESCMGLTASMGREELDAQTFARWGVDFLKNDACGDPDCEPNRPIRGHFSWTTPEACRRKAVQKYAAMQRALNRTGRRIVHSICGWQPWYAAVGPKLGHMWRVGGDVKDWSHVYETVRIMEQLRAYHGRNGWNDPDMLIGSSPTTQFKVTSLQARAQFSLWCVLGAPLMMGTSVLKMNAADLETYRNAEAIRVNQDPSGQQPELAFSNCPPYPKLHLGVTADGWPEFGVDVQGTIDKEVSVNCGTQSAKHCSECPPGECGDHCMVETPGNASRGSTVGSGRCVRRGFDVADRPTPFNRAEYWTPQARRCQQAWIRPLQSGDVALVVVNFADTEVEMRMPIVQSLLRPAPGDSVSMRDLWEPPAGAPPRRVRAGNVTGVSPDGNELQLRLPGDGGHVFLRLGVTRAAEGADPHKASRDEALQRVAKARAQLLESQQLLAEAQATALHLGLTPREVLVGGPVAVRPPRRGSALLSKEAIDLAAWSSLPLMMFFAFSLLLKWIAPRRGLWANNARRN